jgi:hypothetical protein
VHQSSEEGKPQPEEPDLEDSPRPPTTVLSEERRPSQDELMGYYDDDDDDWPENDELYD